MTVPKKEHINDYAKTDAHLYGFDGSQWVGVGVDADGKLATGLYAWNEDTLAFVPLTADENGQLVVSAQVEMPASMTVKEGRPGTSSVVQVASSDENITLKAANAIRLGLTIFNDSTAILYVKFGTTASAADYTVKIAAGGFFEMPFPCYTGKIDGLWAAEDGNAYITEMT